MEGNIENGTLVEPEDPERLAEGIQLVLDNSDLAIRLLEIGYERVKKKFTWPKIVEGYIKEYSMVL